MNVSRNLLKDFQEIVEVHSSEVVHSADEHVLSSATSDKGHDKRFRLDFAPSVQVTTTFPRAEGSRGGNPNFSVSKLFNSSSFPSPHSSHTSPGPMSDTCGDGDPTCTNGVTVSNNYPIPGTNALTKTRLSSCVYPGQKSILGA